LNVTTHVGVMSTWDTENIFNLKCRC